MDSHHKKPTVLLILDGFGVAPNGPGNPLFGLDTPYLSELIRTYPAMTLRASGESVGLTWGEMGNSEVGHLTIGAGRILPQALPRINLAIEDGSFSQNKVLKAAAKQVGADHTVHIIGILSSGNVHGSIDQVLATIKVMKSLKVKKLAVHVILDGRDTIYNTGLDFVKQLQKFLKDLNFGQIASISGRYYAMDRDKRFDRTKSAYEAMLGLGKTLVADPVKAVENSYAQNIFDEEFKPVVMASSGMAVAKIQAGDAVIFTNFRPDRARQLAAALVSLEFKGFARKKIANLFFASMTEYDPQLVEAHVIFPPEFPETYLAKEISKAGLTQLHIAETEKYAHITFFLNGLREETVVGEDRVIIPSPQVAAYDQVPAMSAVKITKRILSELTADHYDVIMANLANADMVGHSGNFEATRLAAAALDEAIKKITAAVLKLEGTVFITADHGNGEEIINIKTDEIDKEHSTNSVPFIVVSEALHGQTGPSGDVPGGDLSLMTPAGMLADVAPTILKHLNLPVPAAMTGQSLL